MNTNQVGKTVGVAALVVGLCLIAIFAVVAGTSSDNEVSVAASNVTTSDMRHDAGVSGPVEQGDTGFGALAFPSLWRDAGVSGPVEQGDTGFGALAFPSLWRDAGVSGPVEQGDTGFGALAFPSLWRDAGVSGPVEQGDTGFHQ